MTREHSFQAFFHSLLREETHGGLVDIRIIDKLVERPEITVCQCQEMARQINT